ncbi:hypothetical protein [Roseomonas indoligenes]|uniref:Uncharacterized protein n=1 Tax=Roseomonas indoligenes TaxID=2820811 RepID=A0A940S6P0_9PROT|nr:hypothetical protein [Pararoseomonas indoligenes]MBP0492193.1 hypothetical protein [Pararoseomonas indoligenes]
MSFMSPWDGDRAERDQRRSYERTRKAAYRAANPEKRAAERLRVAERRQSDVARHLFDKARYRAARHGIAFTLSASDIAVPAACPVLGLALVVGGQRDNSPTLDRLVPSLGYVPSNVRVISYRANRLKSDATLDELKALVAYLEESGVTPFACMRSVVRGAA